ncbi:proteinaceous RNase P 1, chloroplastic/mitochondrial [Selaginella moellendorffii]|uniref:proteinaceous RNase P 1, chloroplastic/mitochondrial n=1 Tax=Selaginella moellendorffii TaxID=88036 RepID=UPI000D1CE9E9|nr:proteinaceous RNase P 1, chloroplastic/mitochondrial [Selaginella moellendorffii]|eukprot:XP_024526419.1 proteinaceous RNase P 1, chloroplastic/mitochondrial [Selaginella moellendorffii]
MPIASEVLEGDLPLRVNYLQLETKKRAATDNTNHESKRCVQKKKKFTPDSELRFKLESCSKVGDVTGALDIYDSSKDQGVKLSQYHYNVLLYLCSSAALGVIVPGKGSRHQKSSSEVAATVEDEGILFRGNMTALVPRNTTGLSQEVMKLALDRGLEIYERMKLEGISANEAAFTSIARLAVAKRDGDLAFSLVKEMTTSGITPKLRSYGPALYTYFKSNRVDKAFEVDDHMRSFGVQPEEMELQILLELSLKAGQEQRVYSVLHRLRRSVREVSPSTATTIERWFSSDAASSSGSDKKYDDEDVRRALAAQGGGGLELGWIGSGRWSVKRTALDASGVCESCRHKMAAVDLNAEETNRFAENLAALACEKERDANSFKEFQEWMAEHGPFDAIVDGANVALFNQNFSAGGFSFSQLNSVVTELSNQHGKSPLVILHKRRVTGGPAASPQSQELLKQWTAANALYTAATGSNDDWYWLYAAVTCKCLLVSNDEMRDHLFQMLGNDLFPRWKERHQARFGFSNSNPFFDMPPPYSTVIQECENGSWHFPISRGNDEDDEAEEPHKQPRSWLCIRRDEETK